MNMEAKKAEAVAMLLADAVRAVDAACALAVQGWLDGDDKRDVIHASTYVTLAHRAALRAIGSAQD
jgi:hypothetical protein